MSDELRDPILAALAITRGHMRALTGESTVRDALEASTLEVAMSADPVALVNALGQVNAHALILAASTISALQGRSMSAEVLLDTIEEKIREGQS